MNPRRIIIIPFIHGKLTHDGKMSEPDIHWIMIRATILVGEDIEGYDAAQDLDLYEYFVSDDQGDQEPPQKG